MEVLYTFLNTASNRGRNAVEYILSRWNICKFVVDKNNAIWGLEYH